MIAALARLLRIDVLFVKAGLVALVIGVAVFAFNSIVSDAINNAFLTEDIEQLKERGKTDAEIDDLDDAALCRELGGVQCDD